MIVSAPRPANETPECGEAMTHPKETKAQTKAEADIEKSKAAEDLIIFGNSLIREYKNGRIEHIPIQEVKIYQNLPKEAEHGE